MIETARATPSVAAFCTCMCDRIQQRLSTLRRLGEDVGYRPFGVEPPAFDPRAAPALTTPRPFVVASQIRFFHVQLINAQIQREYRPLVALEDVMEGSRIPLRATESPPRRRLLLVDLAV